MTVFTRILVAITIALADAVGSAFANGVPLGAPGPIAGAGLPILAVGFGVYWLVTRFHNRTD
jgi:hypothetical protein